MDRLGHVEEVVRAANDPPLDLEPRVLHQGHERVVDLRDTAAERGRREVEHPPAGERLRQCADLVHQASRCERAVVGERLVSDVDELEQAAGYAVEDLGEAQPRAAALRAARQDELVGDRANDRDAETSFGEVLEVAQLAVFRRVEALPFVVHLDDEPVAVELVRDLDATAAAGVRMADGIRRGLGERELEVGDELLRDRPQLRQPGERKAAERDVLGPRRNRQSDDPAVASVRRRSLGRVVRDRHSRCL